MSTPKPKTSQAKATARRRQAVASTGVAAVLVGVVSIYVPPFLSLFIEQRELLFVFAVLLAGLLVALYHAAERFALYKDNYIDRFEAFHLDWLQVFKMLAIFAAIAYAGQIFIDYFMAGPIGVPNLLLCLVVLLGLALGLVPMFQNVILHSGDDDEDEALD